MTEARILLIALTLTMAGCKENSGTSQCTSSCKATNSGAEMVCSLTSAELRERKETVLNSLRSQLTDRKELVNGYAFKFNGSDAMLDELNEFIKTERECCGFFTFNLSISGDKSEAWLELTGPDGAKDFITTELGL